MRTVLIANSDDHELEKVAGSIGQDFEVVPVKSPNEVNGHLENCDAILLDHNFTYNSGIDFLMEIAPKTHIPIIMLTPINESKHAMEAMRIGAFNYLIKTDDYTDILGPSLKDAISHFSEKEQMRATIIDLKKRIAILESQLGRNETSSTEAPSRNKSSIIQEIARRFRSGEINLPSYPHVNSKFKQMLREGAHLNQIAELLKTDASIASKLISVSNSSYYRGLSENKTLEQAISRLGLTETKNVVAIISNRSLFSAKEGLHSERLKRIWEHSLCCGYASELIGKASNVKNHEGELFTLGLLHDIGKLLLLQIAAELQMEGMLSKDEINDAFYESLFSHHGKFGAALFRKWKFPKQYMEISVYHDNLSEATNISKELLVIHLANQIAKFNGYRDDENSVPNLENCESIKLLNLAENSISEICDILKTMMNQIDFK